MTHTKNNYASEDDLSNPKKRKLQSTLWFIGILPHCQNKICIWKLILNFDQFSNARHLKIFHQNGKFKYSLNFSKYTCFKPVRYFVHSKDE